MQFTSAVNDNQQSCLYWQIHYNSSYLSLCSLYIYTIKKKWVYPTYLKSANSSHDFFVYAGPLETYPYYIIKDNIEVYLMCMDNNYYADIYYTEIYETFTLILIKKKTQKQVGKNISKKC